MRKIKNPHVLAIQLSDIKGKQAVMDSFASREFMLMTGGVFDYLDLGLVYELELAS